METAHLETDGELLELKAAGGGVGGFCRQILGTFFLGVHPQHIFLGPLTPLVLALILSVQC